MLGFAPTAYAPTAYIEPDDGQATEPAPTVISVTVSPAAATLAGGASIQLSAVASGANSPPQTFDWTRSPASGSVSSSGLYTAAATNVQQTITVTAASTLNPSATDTCVITVPALVVVDPEPFDWPTGSKLDASQFLNLLPLSATGRRSMATLFEAIIDDLAMVRRAQTLMAAKLDADPGVNGTDFVADATVPDDDVILGK